MEILIGFLGLIPVCAIAFFTYQQYHFEKTKIRIALYEKRVDVYDAITSLIAEIQRDGAVGYDRLVKFLRETKYAKFLFNEEDKITEYLNTLYLKGVDLEFFNKRKDEGYTKEERNNAVNKQHKTFTWFTSQYNEVDRQIKPYLKIEQKSKITTFFGKHS